MFSVFRLLSRRCHFVFVEDLAVLERHRGKGIGKMLVDSILQWAAEREVDEVQLQVWNRNRRAIAFYAAIGFEVTRHTMRRPVPQ